MTNISLRIDDGKHRQATWLELFFDLAFVICVSTLTHLLISDPTLSGFLSFCGLFVPMWWSWNQYTWYASHFDNDDAFFRLFMLWGITGALFLSKGLLDFHHGHHETLVLSYVFIHLGMALGWVRVYQPIKEYRPYIKFKFVGVCLGILLWLFTLLPMAQSSRTLLWGIAVSAQLLMPILAWTTARKMISVHQHHLTERHGLFVIILLGECLLSLSKQISFSVYSLFILASLFSIWWVYFDWKYNPIKLHVTLYAFSFNYGHLLLYICLGVIAAGIGLGAKAVWMIFAGLGFFFLILNLMNLMSQREVRKSKFSVWMLISFLLGGVSFLLK